MSDEIKYTMDDVPHLDSTRWERALKNAKAIVISRVQKQEFQKPERDTYFKRESKYPPILIGIVLVLLVMVALAAFLISAGKQVVAFDIVSRFLVDKYGVRISERYIDTIVVAALMLSEAGVILFGLAANIFSSNGRTTSTFRLFQLFCTVITLLANISVTALNLAMEMPVFDGAVTLIPPLLVIGIGWIMEQMAHTWILMRLESIKAYETAIAEYTKAVETEEARYKLLTQEPTKHPEWSKVWGDCIIDQLRATAKAREVFEALEKDDPQVGAKLAYREWERRQQDYNFQKISEISKKSQNPVSDRSGDSSEFQEQRPMNVMSGLKIMQRDPELMKLQGKELVERFGGSASTWTRVKAEYRKLQTSTEISDLSGAAD